MPECNGPRTAAARYSEPDGNASGGGHLAAPAFCFKTWTSRKAVLCRLTFPALRGPPFSAYGLLFKVSRCLETTIGQGTAPAGRVRALHDARAEELDQPPHAYYAQSHPVPRTLRRG